MSSEIVFIVMIILFIVLTFLRYLNDKRNNFSDIIEVELMKYDLIFLEPKAITWYDNIPSFYDKFRFGDFIQNGGNLYANKYYYRKILLKNKKNDEYIVWARIRKDMLGNYEVLFKPKLSDLN